MAKSVELIFDFVSPNSYMAWGPLKEIAAKHDAKLIVAPVLLGGMHKLTGNQPPFIRDAGIKGKNEYAMLEMRRFVAKHGLTKFKMNPNFPFATVLLQRLLLVAQEIGREHEFIDLMAPAIWEDGLNGADAEAVAGVINASAFEAEPMMARAQDQEIKQRLMDNTSKAVERGMFGVPGMFVGDNFFFGKDKLHHVNEELDNTTP